MDPEKAEAQRVLVVDDNQDFAVSLSVLVHDLGYQVLVAHDGATAVELIREFRPRAIFLDLLMPRLDGFGVARWIRQQDWGHGVCLIAISGQPASDDPAGSDVPRFDYRFIKPVDPALLLEAVKCAHAAG